ncbi:MAG: serine hydrolase domain-containing protein [Thermoguttaceae bacterium]
MSTRASRRLLALPVVLAAGIFAPVVSLGQERPAAPGGRLAAALQPFVDKHQLAGAVVLVADKDKVLDTEAVGYADVAAKKPMQTDCLFWIASQSKPITAAALMMLVDEGKVKLDDPVEKYLPEFHGQWLIGDRGSDHMLLKRPKHPITVRNILSHTSGLPFASPIETPRLDLLPLEYRVRSYAMLPLMFEPDTRNAYANSGLNTAGRIIEVVSGMPYEKFLDKRLFEPLGMKDTTFWPSAERLRRLAKAHRPGKNGLEVCQIDQLTYPLDDPKRQPMPAGGLFSTAADVSLFYRMLANGGALAGKRFLSEQAVRDMTTPQPGNPGYGLALSVSPEQFGHGGAYGTDSCYDKKHGLIMIFLGQHAAWPKGGERALGAFHKAAVDAFASKD